MKGRNREAPSSESALSKSIISIAQLSQKSSYSTFFDRPMQAARPIGVNLQCPDNSENKAIPISSSSVMLSYALTVHRAQGSQYSVFILALHPEMGRALAKEMLYTALTQAQEIAFGVHSLNHNMSIFELQESPEYGKLLLEEADTHG
ncbi:MAG: ATP-binding domain-containing protein [Roseburia sp.]|nr:ATP-binding domain-containing protein [Roseburia sp.]